MYRINTIDGLVRWPPYAQLGPQEESVPVKGRRDICDHMLIYKAGWYLIYLAILM